MTDPKQKKTLSETIFKEAERKNGGRSTAGMREAQRDFDADRIDVWAYVASCTEEIRRAEEERNQKP